MTEWSADFEELVSAARRTVAAERESHGDRRADQVAIEQRIASERARHAAMAREIERLAATVAHQLDPAG